MEAVAQVGHAMGSASRLGFFRASFPCLRFGEGSQGCCWVQERLPGAEAGLAESQPPVDLRSLEKKATRTEFPLW